MNVRDKHFKGQQNGEEVICFFRKHWISLIREFIYLIIFLLIVIAIVSNIETIKEILRGNRELKLLFVTGFLILTIFMHHFFIKLINYFLHIGIITNRRIIDHQKTLFFKDITEAIDMSQIQETGQESHGILSSIFRYGHIKIYLTASYSTKTFYYVPKVKFHFRCINRQKEARQHSRIHGTIDNSAQEGVEQRINKEIKN